MAGSDKIYKNSVKLKDAKDARRFMQRVINLYDKGVIESEKARDFGYLIKVFLDTVKQGELQEQVDELMDIVEQRQGRRSA